MLKRIGVNLALFSVVFIVLFFSADLLVDKYKLTLTFSLLAIYAYHAIFSVFNYSLVEVISLKKKDVVGYLFLFLFSLKIGFFFVMFKSSFVGNVSLEKSIKLIAFFPFVVFSTLEVFFISKILSKE
jgi:hypothetical protein